MRDHHRNESALWYYCVSSRRCSLRAPILSDKAHFCGIATFATGYVSGQRPWRNSQAVHFFLIPCQKKMSSTYCDDHGVADPKAIKAEGFRVLEPQFRSNSSPSTPSIQDCSSQWSSSFQSLFSLLLLLLPLLQSSASPVPEESIPLRTRPAASSSTSLMSCRPTNSIASVVKMVSSPTHTL